MPDDKNTQTQTAAAKEQATAAKDKAAAAASSAAESAKAQARDVADTVSAEATNYAYQARDTAADEVKGVAMSCAAAPPRSAALANSPMALPMSQTQCATKIWAR